MALKDVEFFRSSLLSNSSMSFCPSSACKMYLWLVVGWQGLHVSQYGAQCLVILVLVAWLVCWTFLLCDMPLSLSLLVCVVSSSYNTERGTSWFLINMSTNWGQVGLLSSSVRMLFLVAAELLKTDLMWHQLHLLLSFRCPPVDTDESLKWMAHLNDVNSWITALLACWVC